MAVAPRFALYPVRTIAGFFTARYGGRWPRRLALAIAGIGSVGLLAADLRGGALAVQGVFATDYATGVASTAVALATVWLLRSLLPAPNGKGVIFAALLVMVFIPVFAYPIYQGRLPLPLFIYGYGLDDLATLEQNMIVNKLADVRSLKPMTAPFLQLSMTNFAGFVLALALGFAALPYLLGRHISQASAAPGAAVRRAALSVAWVVWFLLALAAFAVFERIGVAEAISKGIETAAIPTAMLDASGRSWVNLCGITSYSGSEVAAACAKVSGNRGFLRLAGCGVFKRWFRPRRAVHLRIAGLCIHAVLAGSRDCGAGDGARDHGGPVGGRCGRAPQGFGGRGFPRYALGISGGCSAAGGADPRHDRRLGDPGVVFGRPRHHCCGPVSGAAARSAIRN